MRVRCLAVTFVVSFSALLVLFTLYGGGPGDPPAPLSAINANGETVGAAIQREREEKLRQQCARLVAAGSNASHECNTMLQLQRDQILQLQGQHKQEQEALLKQKQELERDLQKKRQELEDLLQLQKLQKQQLQQQQQKCEEEEDQKKKGKPKKWLITFADRCDSCVVNAKKMCASGISIGGFDECVIFNMSHIDTAYLNQHKDILSASRGAGYWLWKPYVIHEALTYRAAEGDILFYCDSDNVFKTSADPLFDLLEDNPYDAVVFEDKFPSWKYTKRDTFILLGCDTEECHNVLQLTAGYQLYRASRRSREYTAVQLYASSDRRIISDDENEMGHPNLPGFLDHRHDQSVASLVSWMWGIPRHRIPSQWGATHPMQDTYGEIVHHGEQTHVYSRADSLRHSVSLPNQARATGRVATCHRHGTQTQVPVLHTTALSCISGTLNSDAGGGPTDNLSPRTMDATDKHSACQALPAFTCFTSALTPLALALAHQHSRSLGSYTPLCRVPNLHSLHPAGAWETKADTFGNCSSLTWNSAPRMTSDDANRCYLSCGKYGEPATAEMTACHQGCVGTQGSQHCTPPRISVFLAPCDTGGGLFTSHPHRPQNPLHAWGTVVNPQGVREAARCMAPWGPWLQ
ncbi:FkbM family methyltransferase [Pelomyxa schiedti]|nr:FkbM family methyltransferase [Pelomyxa schiedti]